MRVVVFIQTYRTIQTVQVDIENIKHKHNKIKEDRKW